MFNFDLKQRQSNTVAMITFWSQFAVYTLNTVLILYLTRPVWKYGIGYSEATAYTFMGVTQAVGYLMPMLGGYMADNVIGLRRSILLGSVLLAIAYLLVMLSGFTVVKYHDTFFIAAYALIPVTNSLLMGTSSALVSQVFSNDEIRSKSGMTIYYMSINLGALLATLIAPQLMTTHYGPLTIFGIVFAGKSIAALNFYWRYQLFDDVITWLDERKMDLKQYGIFIVYLIAFYLITFMLYQYPYASSYIIGLTCMAGIIWFLFATIRLEGTARTKQLIAILLIIEAILFFVLYNQMNTTLILFAQNNSDLSLLGFKVAPANYQMINPIVIIILSLFLPKFYQTFQRFNIPYQFAAGTMLAGIGLLAMWFACLQAQQGLINGNYIGLTYFLITLSELWVSAVGLSMIGLYCDASMISFAMGAWYLSVSLSNIISGRVAGLVALPEGKLLATESLPIYQHYYFGMGMTALILGIAMFFTARGLVQFAKARQLKIA
ncbi:MAG: hypothetical protein ACD_46C00039G0006 [uncultured bacterium]|nr:MAG: hypothetical protein ACD_46C00039G0006 [uncultured bacterium]